MALVILDGASGSGKTTIAEAVERGTPSIAVFRFDTIGVPSAGRISKSRGSPEFMLLSRMS